jgi:hypothetical protein
MNTIATPGNTHHVVTLFDQSESVSRLYVTAVSETGGQL